MKVKAYFHKVAKLIIVASLFSLNTLQAESFFNEEQAQLKIFGERHQFEQQTLNFSDEDKDKIKKSARVRQRKNSMKIWRVFSSEGNVGWFIVDEVIGKHEYITYAVGLDNQGTVNDIVIMNYRETHGGEVSQDSWLKQFVGKSIVNPVKLGKDIDNITGATLSCRNITDGVRRLLFTYDLKLAEKDKLAAQQH